MAKDQVEQVLLAEQMSVEAAKEYAERETLNGRLTYFYDHKPTTEETLLEKAVDRVRLVYQPNLTPEGIVNETKSGEYQTLLIRPKTVLPEANVEKVIRVGTGVNNAIDWVNQSPTRILMNTPGQNASATAEYTVKALLRVLAPTLFDKASENVLKGNLTSKDLSDHFSTELKGKKIAIVGMGDIGIRVAQILKSFGAEVIGWGYAREDGSKSFSEKDALNMGIGYAKSLEDVFTGIDGATIHIPGGPKTDRMIHFDLLQRMNRGASIVNAARGPIIDAESLGLAIDSGIIQGFVADADWFGNYDKDPLAPYIQLIQTYGSTHPNLLVTPHFGGDVTQETNYYATTQALNQVGAAFWEKIIYNAKSKLPEGYKNGGVIKPEGIGRVTNIEVNSVLAKDTPYLQQQLETMLALISERAKRDLTTEEAEMLMTATNSFVNAQKNLLGRPVEYSITK